jgi:diguanylate cyclase (GGDEF)-like protein
VALTVVLWSIAGRRLAPFWGFVGLGFAMLGLADSAYLVEVERGSWTPGGLSGWPPLLGTVLLAHAAWAARPAPRPPEPGASAHTVLPVGSALAAVTLMAYGAIASLEPIAAALATLALLAVVARFALTLTSLTRRSDDLTAQATTDPLTGLANHRKLHERLAAETARVRRGGGVLSVVTIDIDHFKLVNDTYGHAEGDLALQSIARALSAECRPYDLVARVGGEEFVLVLPEVDADEATAIAERCRLALGRIRIQGAAVSCSAGVASLPRHGRDGHRLLELADGALYWAKRSGRAQVRCYDARSVVLLSSADQQEQVRRVLADPEALTPVFQPIVELATGRIGGYEALTRFLRAEPLRAPDEWFAQARRCGLGAALEARAIEVALAVPGRPAGVFLSLNVSPGGLVSPEVAAVLPEDLTDIVIELTEDELFDSNQALDGALADLRARGARIAVDDAGAGYAGLQQVIRVKPEILKLDRSLIRGIHADRSRSALMEALSRFAVSTGAAVCGEGIEELEELRTLVRFDVTYGQGYALARPGPAWPGIDTAVAAEVAAEERWGMRLATRPRGEDAPGTLGELASALVGVSSSGDLARAVGLIEGITHADDVVVSVVHHDERCVETLGEHDWMTAGERFSFDEYPTTERVVVHQVMGQIVRGDPAADPAELRVLAQGGYGTMLMAPVVFRSRTVGLLELYRRPARAWSAAEIDQVGALAHQLGPAFALPVEHAAVVAEPAAGA